MLRPLCGFERRVTQLEYLPTIFQHPTPRIQQGHSKSANKAARRVEGRQSQTARLEAEELSKQRIQKASLSRLVRDSESGRATVVKNQTTWRSGSGRRCSTEHRYRTQYLQGETKKESAFCRAGNRGNRGCLSACLNFSFRSKLRAGFGGKEATIQHAH